MSGTASSTGTTKPRSRRAVTPKSPSCSIQSKYHRKIPYGGHWRFPAAVVFAFLRELGFDQEAAIDAVRNVR
jgi:hypothetical protein